MQFPIVAHRPLRTLAVLTTSLLLATPAFARTAQDAAQSIFGMFGSFANVIMGIIFLAGLALGGYSLILLKNHTEEPKEWPRLRRPFVCLFAAAGMVGYPSYIAMSSNTINGDGAQQNSLSAGVYARIGG